MKGTHLGEFEELVLLTSAILLGNAYSVTIVEEIEKMTGRKLTMSAVHTVLVRLEKKGYLKSKMGGTIKERGGRRKRLYEITKSGFESLNQAREIRSELWTRMPDLSFN